MSHNESVIQWLIVIIIAMVAFLVGRSLFQKPKAQAQTSSALTSEAIEDVLNKVLERTANWDKSADNSTASALPSSASGVSNKELDEAKAELNRLKAALQAKETELKAAKDKASPSGTQPTVSFEGATGETHVYLEKISELEAKLAEYEVLEDDIADLSLYKEENARLKSEMERLKGGGDPADEISAAIPEPENTDDLVKEFAEAVGKDKITDEDEDIPSDVSAEASSVPEPDSAEVNAAPPEAVAGEEKVEETAPSPQQGVDDLFAELASEDLDTDKVVSELAEIEALSEEKPEDVFAESLDPEKIAREADELKTS